jgi:transposase
MKWFCKNQHQQGAPRMRLPRFFQFENYEVADVKEFLSDGFIEIHLKRDLSKPFHCNRCDCKLGVGRGDHSLRVEGLPIMGYRTWIVFRRYKAYCEGCKKARSERVSFLSELTPHLTKELAWWVGRLCEIAAVKKVSEVVGFSGMTTWRVDFRRMILMLSYYKIPGIKKISVDEVYARKKSRRMESREKRFFTVITDIETRKVIWVSEGRSKEALDQFYKLIGKEACEKIEVVAMDQFDGYMASTRENCPHARVVWDRFHLVKNFEQIINDERLLLHQRLDTQLPEKKLTKSKFKYIFMKRADRRSEKEQSHMDYVMAQNEGFYRLELVKERFLTFFDAKDEESAKIIWHEIGEWIRTSRFIELQHWWRTLNSKWAVIANYFNCRFTTAISEGINNVIKTVKRRGYGYRNMRYFRLKIMQVCGYLNSNFIPSQDQLLAQI